MATAAVLIASCSPGEGPESIPLPTSPNTTTTTTTTTPPATTTTLVPPRYEATIRRTTDGVAHITGNDTEDVAFGQGWVSGEDHGCTLVDQVIKVHGERAATLGPGAEGENVASDFAWRAIDIATIAARDFERTASSEVVAWFEAYTAGWNDQLADVGGEGLTGWCAGADWVRPLEPVEVYTYARAITLQASGSRLLDFVASAQPPTEDSVGIRRPTIDLDAFAAAADVLAGDELGSNAWAIGRDQVEGAEGSLLLANPHFPWEGELRFAEVHLTVPGEFDIYGAQLLGLPGLAIGFTDGVAWTHTVSAGKRLTGYNLTLDPESSTSYLIDGVSVPMIATPTTIEILRADGTIDTETRTMWRSEYGPIIDFPGIGWTTTNVLTYRDANIDNDEFVEQYARLSDIQSIDDLIELNAEYQGVPLFNTVAADSSGDVWYADTSATPNLSAEAESLYIERLFTDPLTQVAYDAGFVLLDGSDSRFRWEVVPGARDPGLVPFADMPRTTRSDHVFNANDSFWVPNADTTLTGPYSIMHGEQRSPLSMRTRQNTAVLDATNASALAGPDGLFSADELRTAAFDNAARTALLLRRSAVEACQVFPLVSVEEVLAADGTVSLPAASVDVSAACRVLAGWDGVYDLDRSGPIIWREMMTQFPDDAFTGPGP
ncbi:MAG TPA: penicillin acylase family protein, partial [Ilumatobacteraceae bacterium]|nr:penicillin acylase family protein [Ilumatobacteraceae bacterium]